MGRWAKKGIKKEKSLPLRLLLPGMVCGVATRTETDSEGRQGSDELPRRVKIKEHYSLDEDFSLGKDRSHNFSPSRKQRRVYGYAEPFFSKRGRSRHQ